MVLKDKLSGAVMKLTPFQRQQCFVSTNVLRGHCIIAHGVSRGSLYFPAGDHLLQAALPPDSIVELHADRTSHSP